MTEAKQGRFFAPALDGLRAVAFLMVFFYHGVPKTLMNVAWNNDLADSLWFTLIRLGGYGVALFFSLSAFLITKLLLLERQTSGDIGVRNFYIRRSLRIWPLYILLLILVIASCQRLYGYPFPASEIVRFATFTYNFSPGRYSVPLAAGILWSVCVEEQFYLAWPVVMKFAKSTKALAICAATLIAIGLTFRVSQTIGGGPWSNLWNNTLTHLDCFGWGALAAILTETRVIEIARGKARLIAATAFAAMYLIVHFFPIDSTCVDPVNPFGAFAPTVGLVYPAAAIAYTLFAVCAASIVLACAVQPDSPFAWRPLASAGKLTYGLYCYHAILIQCVLVFLPKLHLFEYLLARLVLTFAVAWVSYKLFEAPILRLKSRFQVVRSGSA